MMMILKFHRVIDSTPINEDDIITLLSHLVVDIAQTSRQNQNASFSFSLEANKKQLSNQNGVRVLVPKADKVNTFEPCLTGTHLWCQGEGPNCPE